MDLFQARLLVELADRLANTPVLLKPQDHNEILMAIGVQRDVTFDVKNKLKYGVEHKSLPHLLAAFWECHISEIDLYETESRLLVDPPSKLKVNSKFFGTYASTNVSAIYGTDFSRGLFTFQKAFSGYFDDVVLFRGIDNAKMIEQLMNTLRPGSTITVCTPTPAHDYWLSWAGFSLSLEKVMSLLTSRFKVKPIHKQSAKNVVTEVLGLEIETTDDSPHAAS